VVARRERRRKQLIYELEETRRNWKSKAVAGVDGRILLRWIFRKWDVVVWTGSSWLRIGTDGGHL